jgi:hypothetical protein
MLSVAVSAKGEDEGSEQGEPENIIAAGKKEETGVVGLNGDLALSMMSKNQRKKLIKQMNQEEEEEKALRDRILKSKADEIEE